MHYLIASADEKCEKRFENTELLFTCYCDEKYQQHPHSVHSHHDMIELLYILRGEGMFEIDGTAYPVKAGDLVIYNNDVIHNETLRFPPPPLYGLQATGIQLDDLPSNWLIGKEHCPVISLEEHASEFRTMFRTIYNLSAAQTPDSAMACRNIFRGLLYMITELTARTSEVFTDGYKETKAYQLGRKIQMYVDEHALEALTVQGVADHFQISQPYLFRLFKQVTGTAFMQYIIQRRMGEAQTLLLITDLSVTEIARAVGYDNLSHFTKMFTQNVGMSPRIYRKQSGITAAMK